jgi:hypothetical protein
VIVPILIQDSPMLRNLLYTGVTRGKLLAALAGQKKAAAIAVRNASSRRRWSKLGERLSSGVRLTDHLSGNGYDETFWIDGVEVTALEKDVELRICRWIERTAPDYARRDLLEDGVGRDSARRKTRL